MSAGGKAAADKKPAGGAGKGMSGRPSAFTPRAEGKHTLLPEKQRLHVGVSQVCARNLSNFGHFWHHSKSSHASVPGVCCVNQSSVRAPMAGGPLHGLLMSALCCCCLCRAVAAALLAALQQIRRQLSPVPPPTADSHAHGQTGTTAGAAQSTVRSYGTSFSFGSDAQIDPWHLDSGVDASGLTQAMAVMLKALHRMERWRCELELGEWLSVAGCM